MLVGSQSLPQSGYCISVTGTCHCTVEETWFVALPSTTSTKPPGCKMGAQRGVSELLGVGVLDRVLVGVPVVLAVRVAVREPDEVLVMDGVTDGVTDDDGVLLAVFDGEAV
jgi:hypothetical protein